MQQGLLDPSLSPVFGQPQFLRSDIQSMNEPTVEMELQLWY